MKALLICPSERPGVRLLSGAAPLACAPLLGQSLLEYWLSHLAGAGFRKVLLLAADRPEQVLALAGNGARWGLNLSVIPEARELSPEQALLKYAANLGPASAEPLVALLEHLPGRTEPLFGSYSQWFAALQAWMPQARTPERVGLHELQPGLWVGRRVRIAPSAQFKPPCWLGDHARIGAYCSIGPHAIIESGALVEPLAEIADSYVAPHTLVGRFTRLRGCLGLGNQLVDCLSGTATQVADPFVLSGLRRARRGRAGEGWLPRLLELAFRKRQEAQLLAKYLSIKR